MQPELDQDGAAIFQQACKMGLEGMSKRLSAPYRSGPSRDFKDPDSPAMVRAREAEW